MFQTRWFQSSVDLLGKCFTPTITRYRLRMGDKFPVAKIYAHPLSVFMIWSNSSIIWLRRHYQFIFKMNFSGIKWDQLSVFLQLDGLWSFPIKKFEFVNMRRKIHNGHTYIRPDKNRKIIRILGAWINRNWTKSH